MGKDIHEVRKYRDESDRNPNSPGASEKGRQIPLWVQPKIQASIAKKWRQAYAETTYTRRYLGG